MKFTVYEMRYTGDDVTESKIRCIPLDSSMFQVYVKLYNAGFYEMRKALGIAPNNVLGDQREIPGKGKGIHLLLNGEGDIIGSVACRGNEIDDLFVSQKYRGRGYGKALLLWAMNHIRLHSREAITLHVAEWNRAAVKLYISAGFEIAKTETLGQD